MNLLYVALCGNGLILSFLNEIFEFTDNNGLNLNVGA